MLLLSAALVASGCSCLGVGVCLLCRAPEAEFGHYSR